MLFGYQLFFKLAGINLAEHGEPAAVSRQLQDRAGRIAVSKHAQIGILNSCQVLGRPALKKGIAGEDARPAS
ncbi:hypothetical protein [Synechococcus sp. CBW1107]|uniref:hypothetical protein n=1 Tax=Synechococcus sp. CBW1107 TaxID=2789857 RepID=UPI002AD30B8F|nr:hypothetical protein [Synechococcus sp. CBW1107]